MIKDALYNSLGGGIRLAVNFLSIPILATVLGTETFGCWMLLYSSISILILFDGGIGLAAVHFLSGKLQNRSDNADKTAAVNSILTALALLLSLFVSGFLVLFAIFKADIANYLAVKTDVLDVSNTNLVLITLMLTAILATAQQLLNGILQAQLNFKTLNVQKALYSISLNLTLILIAVFARSLPLMCVGLLSVSLAYFAYSLIYVVPDLSRGFRFSIDKRTMIGIAKYSSLAWFGSLGSAMFSQMDKFVVAIYLDLNDVGIYSAVVLMCSYIGIAASAPIQSLTAHASNTNDSTVAHKMATSVNFNQIVSFAAAALMMAYLSFSVKQLHSGSLANSGLLLIAPVIYFFSSLNAPGYFYLLGVGKANLTTVCVLLSGASSLVLIYILGLRYGLLGAILGNLGYAFTIFLTVYSIRLLKCTTFFFRTVIVDGVLLLMLFVVFQFDGISIPVKLLLASILFAAGIATIHRHAVVSLLRMVQNGYSHKSV